MAKYEQYEEYKDSGVEWLGEIPKDWEMWKIAHAYLEIGSGTTPPSSNEEWYVGDIPWVTTGELREKLILDTKKKVSKKTIKAFPTLRIYPVGSIAIAMYGATIGRLGILGVEATTNQACCVMSQSNVIFNKFLYYWMQAFKDDIVRLSSGGGQPNINQETVASLKVSTPRHKEQTQIANFLDHETAQIDTLIEKQQTLIQLLKEKRQAVISYAVTKGLNPDAPMKDSGVEWLGEVPEHWEVSKLKFLIRSVRGAVKAGPFGSHLKGSDMEGEDVKVVTQKNVIRSNIDIGDDYISFEKYKELKVFSIFKRDILITTRGTIGRTYVYDTNQTAILHPCLIRIQIDEEKADPNLVSLIIQESGYALEQILVNSNATTIEVIYSDNLVNTFVAVPNNLREQLEILNFIKIQKLEFDNLISKAEQAIELMKERRTALISAAVTGKIDVRGWRAPE